VKLNIEKPTLVLDKARALKNIEKMAEKARRSEVKFRPHFKTHQSAHIGRWFRKYGVNSITVYSVDMAEYFARDGWKDISIAFPVNLRQIKKINTLARDLALHLLVESKDSVCFLADNLKYPVNIWLKIDTGYGRTGVLWEEAPEAVELAREIEKADKLSFCGLLTHSGHSYHAKSKEQIKEIYFDTISKMSRVKEALKGAGFDDVQVSVGDTPTCSVVKDLSGVDEIRPGNFVFYDVQQMNLGSCRQEDIAVAAACPVVAKHKERNEVIIYGGADHLSKDYFTLQDGTKAYGCIALPKQTGWGGMLENSYVSSLSQAHGVVKVDKRYFDKIKIGGILMVLPAHSCLTVNLLRDFLTLDGEWLRP